LFAGNIRSELAEKYKKGGKVRKGMKWNLSTGGFSEQEFGIFFSFLSLSPLLPSLSSPSSSLSISPLSLSHS
jgi:hypothetical protein